jgi:hypothetical protein
MTFDSTTVFHLKNLISRPGFSGFNNFIIFFHDSFDQLIINLNRYHDYKSPHQLIFQPSYLYLIKCYG